MSVKSMGPLAQKWKEYCRAVLPVGVSDRQLQETGRAFYAGAFQMLELVADLGGDHVPEEIAVANLQALRRECIEYFDQATMGHFDETARRDQ